MIEIERVIFFMKKIILFVILIIAFIVTVLVGYITEAVFSAWLNWPGAGAIFAIATMGLFILNEFDNMQNHKKE